MKLKFAFWGVLFIIASRLYSQDINNDTVYFCRQYKFDHEVGVSDLFSISKKGDSITVMLRTKGSIRESHIRIKVEKVLPDTMFLISTKKYDVEPHWDYIFFDGTKFTEEGLYHVSILRDDGTEIAGNFVTIVFNQTK